MDKTQTNQAATPDNASEGQTGALLNVTGLIFWLSAMLLAIAGPLLGIAVPPLLIVGIVVFSAAFSFLSLPTLLRTEKHQA